MKRWLVGSLLAITVLTIVTALLVWRAFTPPGPLGPTATAFALHNMTVINPGASRTTGQNLTVRDGLIQAIASGEMPSGALQALNGMYVLPGLADMHAHLPPRNPLKLTSYFLLLNLAHGVTSIRDAGDLDGTSLIGQREATVENYPGPRVFPCGPFVSAGVRKWANTVLLTGPGDAERAAAQLKADGFHCIKAYDGLTQPMVSALREAGRRHGLSMIGHVPEGLTYEQALIPDTQHLMGVTDPLTQTADHRLPLIQGWRGVDEARLQAIVEITRQSGIANTPTLVYEQQLLKLATHDAAKQSPEALMLPRLFRDVVWHPAIGIPGYRNMNPEEFERTRLAHEKKLRLTHMLYRAGARLYLGTDVQQPFTVPGISLQQEMRLFVKSGIPPEAVWTMATRDAGRSLGLAGLGNLDAGAPADFLIFRKDPTGDLANLDTLEAVVTQGRLFTKAAIDAKIAEYRAHYAGLIFDTLSIQLAKAALRKLSADPH
jgi:Amidohydrolase family